MAGRGEARGREREVFGGPQWAQRASGSRALYRLALRFRETQTASRGRAPAGGRAAPAGSGAAPATARSRRESALYTHEIMGTLKQMIAGKAIGYDRASSEIPWGGGCIVASPLYQLFIKR
ncbi:hypothetical protein EVAR_29271_1 [Eumeta japonica]|uniref:Uncharacterized protein n=1 Tax=Eumeta variegata TaxID=151549 RepID=A0A4C1VTM3_EUMVA|nr:hypothetical protein EVAR_29271_1 [Eumeta japonica]